MNKGAALRQFATIFRQPGTALGQIARKWPLLEARRPRRIAMKEFAT
ncbi:hypothetical protein [Sphingopyxis sp. LK2115]|jgi:hypothetical protein|nr:hypothetical protein [Sphingopyxis sp. LK2115]